MNPKNDQEWFEDQSNLLVALLWGCGAPWVIWGSAKDSSWESVLHVTAFPIGILVMLVYGAMTLPGYSFNLSRWTCWIVSFVGYPTLWWALATLNADVAIMAGTALATVFLLYLFGVTKNPLFWAQSWGLLIERPINRLRTTIRKLLMNTKLMTVVGLVLGVLLGSYFLARHFRYEIKADGGRLFRVDRWTGETAYMYQGRWKVISEP